MMGEKQTETRIYDMAESRFLCLQETKMESMSRNIVRSIWGNTFVDWVCLEPLGASGGILLMWDRRVVDKVEQAVGEYSITCEFQNTEDDLNWVYSGVYGPIIDGNIRQLWEELAGLDSWCNVPWCIGSGWGGGGCGGEEFTVVHFPSERWGNKNHKVVGFSEFILEHALLDVLLEGGAFTCLNNHNSLSMSRLDRFLVSPYREVCFLLI